MSFLLRGSIQILIDLRHKQPRLLKKLHVVRVHLAVVIAVSGRPFKRAGLFLCEHTVRYEVYIKSVARVTADAQNPEEKPLKKQEYNNRIFQTILIS